MLLGKNALLVSFVRFRRSVFLEILGARFSLQAKQSWEKPTGLLKSAWLRFAVESSSILAACAASSTAARQKFFVAELKNNQ